MVKHHEVPTHLNVEDKVVFGLTVRQFLYMLVGSSATYTIWDQTSGLPTMLRVSVGVICVVATLAFALLRVADRPLEEWAIAFLVYLASPKRTIWQPADPDLADWRPAGGGWQEFAPSLAWAEDDSEWP
jgi:hypothetical protein